jgi:light-regulated signal transduction histidine kinase (bacteriophytochrome)
VNAVAKDFTQDIRIEKIYEQLVQYSTGNFSVREDVSDKGDELDAIIVGLNTLGEELHTSGRALNQFETRINRLLDVLIGYIQLDFTQQVEVSEAGDELDAIAVGLNTLAEELKAARETEKRNMERLREQNDLISILNNSLQDNIVQLELSNRELEAFTYSVSHDLRTPLRAIHSYTKILSEEYMSGIDEEGKKMMDSVLRNAKKMGQLIDDLLSFSKVGKKELMITFVDMNKLVASVLKDLQGNAKEPANIRFSKLPPALGDHNLLGLVWTNLLSNAIKYSAVKENQTIEIGNYTENGRAVYYVKDNGAGFDMQYYDKLFGVFHRLHAESEFEGTGVGLALVNRIISRHGGRIWAEGKVNEGATFYFTLNN